MTLPQILGELPHLVGGVPAEDLPALMGRLAEAQAVAMARLMMPSRSDETAAPPGVADHNLPAAEAARRLGVSHHAHTRHRARRGRPGPGGVGAGSLSPEGRRPLRGQGRIYRRGARLWVEYWVGGKQFREPGGATEAEAKRKLKARLEEIAGDRFIGPQEERATVGELLDDLMTHLKNKGAKAVAKLSSHLKAVRAFFADRQAASVTTPLVERYTQERLGLGRARATVNRELEALRQAYNLASRRTPPRVSRVLTSPS